MNRKLTSLDVIKRTLHNTRNDIIHNSTMIIGDPIVERAVNRVLDSLQNTFRTELYVHDHERGLELGHKVESVSKALQALGYKVEFSYSNEMKNERMWVTADIRDPFQLAMLMQDVNEIRPIRDVIDYDQAQSRWFALSSIAERTPAQDDEMQVLEVLTEASVREADFIGLRTGAEVVRTVMIQKNITIEDMKQYLGKNCERILEGKMPFTVEQIRVISHKLDIPLQFLVS